MTVLGDDGSATLSARQVVARIRLRPLLHRQLVIAAASIDGLAATITRASDGSLQLAGLAGPAAGAAGAAAPPPDLTTRLPRLSLRNSQLTIVHTALVERPLTIHALAGTIDPQAPGLAFRLEGIVADHTLVSAAGTVGALQPPWEALPLRVELDLHDADPANLQPWLPAGAPTVRAPVHAHVSAHGTPTEAEGDALIEMADGTVDWSGWALRAPLRGSGHLRWAETSLTLSGGTIDAAAVAHGALRVQAAHASFELAGGTLTLTGATLHACGGTWSQTGRVAVAGAAGPIDAALHAEGVDGGQLLAALPGLGASPLHVEATLTVDAKASAASGAAPAGRVELRTDSGFIEASGVRASAPLTVSAALRDADGTLTLSDGRASAQQVQAAGIEAADLAAQFSLDARTLSVTPLRATAYGGAWSGEARVPLDDAGAWTGSVQATDVALGPLLAAAVGRAAGDPASRDGIADVSATLGGAPDGSVRGDGSGRLTSGNFVWGPLQADAPAHLSATFSADAAGLQISSAQAQAAAAAYAGLAATQAAASFSVVGDRLTFGDLRFHACGGTWTHSGWFALSGTPAFAGDVAIDGADPQAVMALVGVRVPSVELRSGDAQATFQGVADGNWRQHLSGSGSVTLRDGTVRAPAILPALWQAIFRRAAPLTGLERPTRIERVSASFDLRDGVVHSQDLFDQTDDYTMTGAGTFGLDGSLDLSTRLTLTAQGMQKLLTTASLPLPTSGLPSLPPIPTTIGGTFERPQIRPDISALPASTMRWLVGAVLQAPRELGGAVVDGLDGLFGGTRRLFGREAPTPSP